MTTILKAIESSSLSFPATLRSGKPDFQFRLTVSTHVASGELTIANVKSSFGLHAGDTVRLLLIRKDEELIERVSTALRDVIASVLNDSVGVKDGHHGRLLGEIMAKLTE